LREFLSSFELASWMDEDEALLKQVLGDAFEITVKEQTISVSERQWQELEAKLDSRFHTDEDRKWLDEVKRWKYKPFKSLITHYPLYVMELAERTGKLLHPVGLRGADMLVDTRHYQDFARSLIHVVRNLLSHGIETPDERTQQAKDKYGAVTLAVELNNGQLCIEISDDGRGIDTDRLRAKALTDPALNMEQAESASLMSDDEAMLLIFNEQFTTSQEITELSGRGVGLSVVKQEVDKLSGSIEVKSTKGKGTAFRFFLPYHGITEERVYIDES
jgi:two-component system chemotaxis sensor kinase CheA